MTIEPLDPSYTADDTPSIVRAALGIHWPYEATRIHLRWQDNPRLCAAHVESFDGDFNNDTLILVGESSWGLIRVVMSRGGADLLYNSRYDEGQEPDFEDEVRSLAPLLGMQLNEDHWNTIPSSDERFLSGG